MYGSGRKPNHPIAAELVERVRSEPGLDASVYGALLAQLSHRSLTAKEAVHSTGVPEGSVREAVESLAEAFACTAPTLVLNEAGKEAAALLDPAARTSSTDLLAALTAVRGLRPAADREHDQVRATEETLVARAEYLNRTYDLTGKRILFLGDADLTSLAVAIAVPAARITVLDLDERVLAFLGAEGRRRGFAVETVACDLRVDLPPGLAGRFDLVFTDPPYTDLGMRLFLTRAASALVGPGGRIVFCFGVSDRGRERALPVQEVLQRLGLMVKAVWPEFNRYYGAEVLGARASLYDCAATPLTSRAAATAAAAIGEAQAIYTGGSENRSGQAQGRPIDLSTRLLDEVGAAAGPLRFFAPAVGQGRDGEAAKPLAELLYPNREARRYLRAGAGAVVVLGAAEEGTARRAALALSPARIPALLLWRPRPGIGPLTGGQPGMRLVARRFAIDPIDPPRGWSGARLAPLPLPDDVVGRCLWRFAGHTGRAGNGAVEALIAAAEERGLPRLTKKQAAASLSQFLEADLPPGSLVELPGGQIDRLAQALELAAKHQGNSPRIKPVLHSDG